jgi:hypothetical protein
MGSIHRTGHLLLSQGPSSVLGTSTEIDRQASPWRTRSDSTRSIRAAGRWR